MYDYDLQYIRAMHDREFLLDKLSDFMDELSAYGIDDPLYSSIEDAVIVIIDDTFGKPRR